jgi:hypothetical protein
LRGWDRRPAALEGPKASVAGALAGLTKLGEAASKAGMTDIRDTIVRLSQETAAGVGPSASQLHETLVGWLQKTKQGGTTELQLLAQAALDNLGVVEAKLDQTAAKMDAATLKSQQAVVQNLGKMARRSRRIAPRPATW